MSRFESLSRRWGGAVCALGALALLSPLAAMAKSNTPVGFGYQVTGGGNNATVYEVSTAEQLEKALCDPNKLSTDKRVCKDTTPKIIKITGIIDYNAPELRQMKTEGGCYYSDEKVCTAKGVPAAKWDRLVATTASYNGHCEGHTGVSVTYNLLGLKPLAVGSNTTLMGVGKNSGIKGRGLIIRSAKNVIVRNLSITDINERVVFAGDGISIEDSDGVWIAQNRFTRIGRQWLATHLGKTTHITISNNDFDGTSDTGQNCDGDHYYGLLLDGANESITMIGNWFHNFRGRTPKIFPPKADGALPIVHLVNNYFQSGSWHALDAHQPARVLVEGNYFDNVDTPIIKRAKASDTGYLFAPLVTVKEQCQGLLGRVCTANVIKGANPKPSTLPVNEACTFDMTVLDIMNKTVAASGGGDVKPYPAKNVPRRVMAEAGPQDWVR